MALTINPAVGGVGYRRWLLHVALFALGVTSGALVTYAIARSLYAAVAEIAPTAWLAVALPLIAATVLRDLGVHTPVPYPARRQVPEWLRRALPPGPTALLYGGELGTGFLTRFTHSTHTAFVFLLATQAFGRDVMLVVLAFASAKSIVVVTSAASGSYPELEQRVLRRYRMTGQTTLRVANALVAAAAGVVLIATL